MRKTCKTVKKLKIWYSAQSSETIPSNALKWCSVFKIGAAEIGVHKKEETEETGNRKLLLFSSPFLNTYFRRTDFKHTAPL